MRALFLTIVVEVIGRRRQGSIYLIVVGLATLAWFSVALGAGDLSARRDSYFKVLADLAQEQVRPRLGLAGRQAEPVLRIVRPPELGSIIARGQDLSVPAYFDFGPAGSIWARSVAFDTVQLQAGTLLDLESVIRVVGGFLALLLGLDATTAARTKGVVKAWAALGANPTAVTLGKLFGCWVILVVVSTVVMSAAAVSAVVRLPDDTGNVGALFARCLVPTLLYLGCFTAVGAACAVWLRHPTSAFVGGIAIWIVSAMLWPQIVALGARIQSPTDLRVSIEAKRDQAVADELRAGEDALGDAIVARIGQVSGDETAQAVVTQRAELEAIWLTHAERARAAATTIETAWIEARTHQASLARLGGFLGPGTTFLRAMAALSATDDDIVWRWPAAADAHQRKLSQLLFDDRPQVIVRAPAQQARQVLPFVRRESPRWQELPAFDAPLVTPFDLWRSAARSQVALVGYCGLFVLLVAIGTWRRPF